ncbi:MAG: hypothetical protein MJ233_00270 [Mycoplasmoidaceae bacterium]|nr:hypothetical protein [Mycoplasmoidaceae bacterium]
MLKIHKIINSTIFGLSSLTPMIVSCTSCSIGDDIQNIQLFPDSNTIRPGETIPIRAVVFPSGRRTNNLKWELVDNTHPEITIDNQGVLHASPNLAIPELENIRVRASAPSHSSVYTICDISILPLPTYDFQGFYNNEVRYLDLEHNICSMPLEKLDTFTYVTKEHINLFEMDFAPKPDPFKSFIDFKPIISGQSLPYQSFQLANGKYAAHGIS